MSKSINESTNGMYLMSAVTSDASSGMSGSNMYEMNGNIPQVPQVMVTAGHR